MTSLRCLASAVSYQAAEISTILATSKISSPSFAEDGGVEYTEAGPDTDSVLRKARNELISAAQDIIRLAKGPTDEILTLAWSAIDTANLGTIVRFKIPQSVPFGASISIQDLGLKTGLPVDILARTIRYAITNGMFSEPSPGNFRHTAVSACLAQNEHIQNIALFSTHEISSVIVKLADSLALQQEKKEAGPAAAFDIAYPSFENAFELFNKNADASGRYHNYLNGRVNTSRWSVHHFTTAWDWASVGSGTIIDVGGSSGHTCRALAPICPDASFIVQDMSTDAMKSGRLAVSSNPDLQKRITFVIHNFFTPQPTVADIYIFRHILHDWSDADSVCILKALVPALRDGARIMISEGIVPEPPAIRASTLDEKQIRIEDTIMLAVHYARERSVAEYVDLFTQANESYHFVGVTGGKGGAFQSLLEFVFKR